MKNLKIGMKLLVTFGVILTMFLITVATAIVGLTFEGNQFKDFYEYSYPLSMQTLDIRTSIQTAIKATGLSMLTDDEKAVQSYIDEANTQMEEVRTELNQLMEIYRGDTGRIESALNILSEATDYRVQIQQLAAVNNDSEAAKVFFEKYNPKLLEAEVLMEEMDENTGVLADDTYSNAAQAQQLVILLAIAISIVAVLVTVLMALYMTKMLNRPIAEIKEAATQMAEGNLSATIDYHSKDELGQLSESIRTLTGSLHHIIGDVDYLLEEIADGDFTVTSKNPDKYVGDFTGILLSMRKLRDRLCSTLTQIDQSSDQVSTGSDQVSSGAQALSQGATEQAGSIEELAAAINKISDQVKESAQNAQKGSEMAVAAGASMEEGNRQMQEMIAAMAEISDKSGQIGKIIKTIEDIAFQTNILALNAAVEAARAGAAGKGFAVVADEVRNLASKSAEASKSTSTLIEGSVLAVERGTKLADRTALTFTEVMESAKQVVTVIDGISQASSEQAGSIAQVTQGINQISGVVQTNSATAEESAAASEELSGQAQILKDLIGQFKLSTDAKEDYSNRIETHAADASGRKQPLAANN